VQLGDAYYPRYDYDREMGRVTRRTPEQEGREVQIGVARYATNPDGESCEFAIVVGDAWNHKGIGHKLMAALMEAARHKGLKIMEGEVLGNNRSMLSLATRLGFTAKTSEEDSAIKRVTKAL